MGTKQSDKLRTSSEEPKTSIKGTQSTAAPRSHLLTVRGLLRHPSAQKPTTMAMSTGLLPEGKGTNGL